MIRALVCVASALLAFANSAPAATLRSPLAYDGLYTFGDSLSDDGNAYALSFGFVPESPPYYRGRFSDGPIWYDHVARAFRNQDLETVNYAVGGARARANLDFIPDLQAQRRVFRDRADPGPDPLAAIWIGSNDLFDRVGKPGVNRAAREAADEVAAAAAALHRRGVDSALIFNLPNLSNVPRYVDASKAKRRSARRGTKTFNARLARSVEGLRDDGMTVIEVDVFGLFADVRANPGDFGIANLTEPCLRRDRNRCTDAEARESAFFDAMHPSATLHAILGEHVLDQIAPPPAFASLLDAPGRERPAIAASGPGAEARVAPVPLPTPALLLLGALVSLRLAARRRSR